MRRRARRGDDEGDRRRGEDHRGGRCRVRTHGPRAGSIRTLYRRLFGGGRVTTDVLMPALSPTMEEGTLSKWHVKVGDTVKSGEVIADIETVKAPLRGKAVPERAVETRMRPEG